MDIRLNELNKTIINCKKCPRLVKFVQEVSTKKPINRNFVIRKYIKFGINSLKNK